MRFTKQIITLVLGLALIGSAARAQQKTSPAAAPAGKKPNILVIFGDDIGTWNVSAYSLGMMGKTPNIDRIGKEGIVFTDHYGQPSCTAGRAAVIRSGERRVGEEW